MRKLLTIGLAVLATTSVLAAPPKTVTIKSLKVLAVTYRGAPEDSGRLDDQGVLATHNAFEYARRFYFRNTQCRLNLDFQYKVIDQSAPKHDGPTYEYITKDLREKGVKDGEYDGIVCVGVGFTSNYGGFVEFGHTGCAFGSFGKGTEFGWVPENDPNVFYPTSWIITHEFQHALDAICDISGHPEMLSAHPYSDSSESYFKYDCHKAGTHWDWIAHTLTSFKDYLDVKATTNSTIVAIDADGDGMPDNDPRLPMDEKRFGSDPTKKDTDSDGLDDLHEFCADIYRGSDPRKADTDGDGIPDGKDRHPTVAMAETMSYAASEPNIDGKLDKSYKPFTTGMYADNSPALESARMSACWNEDAIYLFVKSAKPCTLSLFVDSSAENGLWEGGDTYMLEAHPDGTVTFNELCGKGAVPGAKAAWGPDGLEVKIPALMGQGISSEINYSGKRRPVDVVDGLKLLDGKWISFYLHLIADKDQAIITPNWSMFDTKLVKSAKDPSKPSLRFSTGLTRMAMPTVVVSGVSIKDKVTIVNNTGKVLGERIGSGEIKLKGARIGNDTESGKNVIKAKVGKIESMPFTLTIDSKALPPVIARPKEGKSFKITGESGAKVDIIPCSTGTDGTAREPIYTITLDKDGNGEFDATTVSKGFVGAYGVDKNWDSPTFWRIDPKIDFDFHDGSPDPRIANDNFCARWLGYLNVAKEGSYTFYLSSDDGSKLFIDGKLVVDYWGHHAAEETRANSVDLTAGKHLIQVDYFEEDGSASAHLDWSGPGIEKTSELPVTPLSVEASNIVYGARQTDQAGNVSEIAK